MESNKNSHYFYKLIVKSLFVMLDKGNYNDKINFIFKTKNVLAQNYLALCTYTNEDYINIMEKVEYVKDGKKKIKLPNFDDVIKISKYFQKTQDYNILIIDKNAEFILRNHLAGICLKVFSQDCDSKQVFKSFNKLYEELLTEPTERIIKSLNIQTFTYNQSELDN